MNVTRPLSLTLLALAILLGALPASAAEEKEAPARAEKSEEGEKKNIHQHQLSERIRPVSGNLFFKEGKIEISPSLGMSLADAFFQKYSFGLKLDYHLVESFAIGVHFSYSLDFAGGAVSVCDAKGCEHPTVDRLKDVPGKIGVMAGLDLMWSPIYGKLNVMAEKVLHFDTSLIAGGSLIQYQTPGGGSGFAPALHLGLGQRYFITPGMTLRLELRDYIYSASIVTLGNANSKVENQLMFELGLSFFVGGKAQD